MAKKNKFISQLSLPEMRPFWLMVLPLVALNLIIFFQLAYLWGIISLGISLLVLLIVFWTGIKSAQTRFHLISERNQTNAIVSNFTDPVVAYDDDFNITAFNSASEELFKIRAEDIMGKKISPEWVKNKRTAILAQTIFPSLAPSMVFKSRPDEYPQVIDIVFPDPYLEFTVTTVKIIDPLGKILGFFKIIEDNTREKELLIVKSEFLTVAAHQLRTPLSAIRWTFESVINGDFGKVTEDQRGALENGLTATEKVLKTANDLLDTANIESGKYGYDFDQNDLANLIQKTKEVYQPLADKHNIKIYVDLPTEVGLIFSFDIARLKMVFQNLIENAIRYNVDNGEIVIKAEKKDPYVEISVRDTGIGIPQDEISKLFTKFFRAKNVVKFETEGTGLGLYIAKNIVEAHGGKIWAESVENRGTTFFFTLPIDEKLIPQFNKLSN